MGEPSRFTSRSFFDATACLPLTCLAAALLGGHANAGDARYRFVEVRTILGPCCPDAGADLMVDVDGGVLVAGSRGGLDLDRDGSVDVQTYGSPDPLILKTFDDNIRGWVQGPGGPKPDRATGIASDRRLGAYAVGTFGEKMHIWGREIFSEGRSNGFLVRYNQDGETQWARAIGGSDQDSLSDVASDTAGNVYIVGTIHGALDVDRDGTVDVTVVGESAVLLASFDPVGNLRWARASAGDAAARGLALTIGPAGELYLGGIYGKGAVDFDADGQPDVPAATVTPAGATVTPETDMNAYYARFDSSGDMVWVRAITGPAIQSVASLAVAGNGDLLVLGGYTDSADLDDDGVPDLEFKSLGNSKPQYFADGNSLLLRVTPDGEQRWARRYVIAAGHVAADTTRIVVCGMYNGPLDVDDDGIPEREADGDPRTEGFAAIFDGEGNFQQVFTIVGGDSDIATAAAFSPDGAKLYVTGYTKLGADFDNDGRIETASACHQLGDFYLARYDVSE